MGDEPGEAEAQRVGFLGGSLEVLPSGVRDEALDDIARTVRAGALVEECEADGVGEGPAEESVVFPREDLDVDWHVGALARTIAVEEERRLEIKNIFRQNKRRHKKFKDNVM